MKRHGTILAAVLIVIAMASMVAVSLLYRMSAEVSASRAGADGQRAYLAAVSGLQQAIAVLTAGAGDLETWRDNPTVFRNQLVHDDGVNRWYFTVYAPDTGDSRERESDSVRYGLIDEAGKINLNAANETTLLRLPGMTAELVDCLMDYRDRDDVARPAGAEQDYYSALSHPYVIKNGPLATVEELLLVKGFDGQVVYGDDYNLNGLLDKNEDDGKDSFPPDNENGRLDRGLLDLATVVSYELDRDNDGKTRVCINGDLAGLARTGLPDKTVDFIKAYRSEGKKFKHPSELLEMRYQSSRSGGRSGRMGWRLGEETRGGGGGAGGWIESGVGAEQLPTVMDKLTAAGAARTTASGAIARMGLSGLVNVNTAPVEVLAAVAGIGEDLARDIVAARGQIDPEKKTTPAWIYVDNLVDAAKFKEIAPRLTARSFQFRIRCIGFGVPCGRFYVVEAVVDMASSAPRIVYTRDLTRLGLPMALDVTKQEL